MAKGYVDRNYLQREGDFPDYKCMWSLNVLLTILLCLTKSIFLVSPILIFHCSISGRTECLLPTLWPLIAENFTLALNSLYSVRTEGYEVISWNVKLLHIVITLNVYTDIWEESVQ